MIRIPYVVWRDRPSPIIEVELRYGEATVRTLAYLDTGATFSIFLSDYSKELGMDFTMGLQKEIMVGDGNSIMVFLHSLPIFIEERRIDTLIGFSAELGTGVNIIGRDSLMDEFRICFDGVHKQVNWHFP